MTTWTKLATRTEPIERGNLLRCSIDGSPVVMMWREPDDLVVLTGSRAGTVAFTLPHDARDPRWLAEHCETCIPSAVDVCVRGDLEVDEIVSTPRIALADFDGVLEPGRLLECPFGYPFEGRIYLMVTEVDRRFGFVTITGYKAGIRAWWVPPPEAQTSAGIDSRWLAATADRWLFGDVRLEHIFVRARLTAAELE